MQQFSIRDVENLSGIRAHTLRMWEQRHGLRMCKRKESQHRYYDNDDLKYILRIAYLYHNGYRISRIAALSGSEISSLASKRFNNDEYEVLVNRLIEAVLDYDDECIERTLHEASENMGMERCIEKLIHPFLDKIGLLWITGHVLPAQEHICSNIIMQLIVTCIEKLPPVRGRRSKVLLFTPENEMHEIPILIVQYLLKKKGVQTILLGKNVSGETLALACRQLQPTHLYLHLITNFTRFSAVEYLHTLSKNHPALHIFASGPSFRGSAKLPARVQLLRSFDDVLRMAADAATIFAE